MTRFDLRLLVLPLALTLGACNGDGDGEDTDTEDTTDTTDTTDTEDTDDTQDTEDTDSMEQSIVDTVVGTERFSILEEAVIKAGLTGALTGGITVFAPNDTAFNEAFTALGVSGVDDLSIDQLTAILTYHVIGAEVDADAAIGVAESMEPTAQALGGTLDLTLDGSDLMVDQATVINANIGATDGIIHEIDAVLLPNIVDVVTTDAQLTVLTQAVLAAEGDNPSPMLVDALSGGTLTLFAPTDTAFGDLLTGNSLEDLNAVVTALGGLPQLTGLLQYHVLGTQVDAAAAIAADGTSVTALAGGDITVDVIGGSVVLNDGVDGGLVDANTATVVTVDIITSNGVIHKIDKVIAPPAN